MSIRNAASWPQPWHVSDVPRGARKVRIIVVIGDQTAQEGDSEDKKLSSGDAVVNRRKKSKSVDNDASGVLKCASTNQLSDRIEIRRRRSVVVERRHDTTHRRVHV